MKDDEIDKNIRKTMQYSTRVLILAFFVLIISLIIDIISTSAEPFYWFQRSGSIVVLLSAGAEFWLSKFNSDINPPPSSYVAESQWNEIYGKKYNFISLVALCFLVVGTFVWGYGDIPFKNS